MSIDRHPARVLTVRYVGALLVVAALLGAGQTVVQIALDRQEGDARVVNIAGRQRMLSQRLTMLLFALAVEDGDHRAANRAELGRVADEWERNQALLRRGAELPDGNSATANGLFVQIEPDHRAMVAAARTAVAADPTSTYLAYAAEARAHEAAFLSGMDRIVATYELEARDRVIRLRRLELALFGLGLAVLILEGLFVFRPAVRGLRVYLAERDAAQRALLEISEREQKRIAQDLHDGLSQHLIGVSYLVKSLREDLAGGPHEQRIEEVGRLLAESVDHTRGLARSLYSHVLEVDGLAAALRELADHTERVFGVECRVRDRSSRPEVGHAVRDHLYRIAREAMLNAAKHARATAIEIELSGDATRLELVVRDDGVGIDPNAPEGMGLHLMQSRAKMLGAPLKIASGQPRGTIVSCTVSTAGASA